MTAPLQRWTRDDWVIPFVVKDGSGVPINLTGYTIGAEFTPQGVAFASDLTQANGGGSRTSDANGQFVITVPRTFTWCARAG